MSRRVKKTCRKREEPLRGDVERTLPVGISPPVLVALTLYQAAGRPISGENLGRSVDFSVLGRDPRAEDLPS